MNSFTSRPFQHLYPGFIRQVGLARLLVILLNITLGLQITAIQSMARSTWTESSFEDFNDGTFPDARSNLYVSAKGRLQIISRWDLNHDGFVDLVVPSGHTHTEKENTYIYLNHKGNIDARTRIDLPGGGSSAGFIADLNRDGLNDLVVANRSDSHVFRVSSWVYWGGRSGFSGRNRAELPAFSAKDIVSGDYNGDGWQDLAIACQWKNHDPSAITSQEVSLIYWNSPEGFNPERRLELPLDGESGLSLLTADLDGDGRDDLMVQTSGKIHLFKSSEAAFDTGVAATHLALPGSVMVLGDFNGDGNDDLATANGEIIQVITSKGGRFDPDQSETLNVSAPRDLCAADVDNDGDDDLIVANYSTPGGATWTDSLVFISHDGGFGKDDPVRLPTLGATSVSARDLNDDGYPELVFSNANVTNQRSLFSYVYWNEKGTFRFGNHTQLPTAGTLSNAIGDVNNDGEPDVVFFNDEGGFRDGASQTDIYWGDGTKNFSPDRSISFPTHQIFGIGNADLDDDGYVDLLLTRENFINGVDHEQTGITIKWGGEKGFKTTSEITVGSSYGGVRIADINKDGYLDILSGGIDMDPADPSRVGFPIHWGSADGFLRKNRSVVPSTRDKTRGPLLADLDQDGWLDVAAQEVDGTITIWSGSAKGYGSDRRQVIDLERPDLLMYIQAADLNRDGWLDLLLPQRGSPDGTEGTSLIYFGSPKGFSNDRRDQIPSYVGYQNSIADLDRDGWLDIVLMAYGGEVSGNRPSLIYWGGELGFMDRPRSELPTYGSSGSLTLDFDGDGWLDIFITNHRQSGSTLEPFPHRHNTVSMLYWGGPQGFAPERRLDIPARGPSGLNLRDPGNIYDRSHYEYYQSNAQRIPPGEKPVAIDWTAETPFDTSVRFQIRAAATESKLEDTAWVGGAGPGSWWTAPGIIDLKNDKASWIQYRVRLMSPNSAGSPILSRVALYFD